MSGLVCRLGSALTAAREQGERGCAIEREKERRDLRRSLALSCRPEPIEPIADLSTSTSRIGSGADGGSDAAPSLARYSARGAWGGR